MNKTPSSPHNELLNSIALLKEKKRSEEKILKQSLKDLASSLRPISLIKESLHELATDKEVKQDLVTAGIKLGTNFLIEKVMGGSSSIKSFIGSALVKQLAAGLITKKVVPFFVSNGDSETIKE